MLTRRVYRTAQSVRFLKSTRRPEPLQVERIDGAPTLAKIRAHPFRWYKRFGSYTFGLCFTCNVLTMPFDETASELVRKHPQWTCAALLCKSLYFGALWPSFYPCALFAPRKTLVLGGGVRSLDL